MCAENVELTRAAGTRPWALLGASVVGAVAVAIAACSGDAGPSGSTAVQASAVARHFAIEGMTCLGCVETVTEAVAKLPGIKRVEVSLQEKRVRVIADASVVPDSAIETAVSRAGYQARAIHSPPATPESHDKP